MAAFKMKLHLDVPEPMQMTRDNSFRFDGDDGAAPLHQPRQIKPAPFPKLTLTPHSSLLSHSHTHWKPSLSLCRVQATRPSRWRRRQKTGKRSN